MRELTVIRGVTLAIVPLAAAIAGLSARQLSDHDAAVVRGGDPIGATFGAVPGRPLLVTSLRAGGAAERAGLKVGDVVEAVNGRPMASPGEIAHAATGSSHLDIRVRRGKEMLDTVIARRGG